MRYLMLGGPFHGGERELANGENEATVMGVVPGDSVPTPFKYQLKTIQAETRPGLIFQRSVLVESSMPVEIAQQALSAVLMQRFAEQLLIQFMEGGELVNGTDEQDNVYTGLLTAKR